MRKRESYRALILENIEYDVLIAERAVWIKTGWTSWWSSWWIPSAPTQGDDPRRRGRLPGGGRPVTVPEAEQPHTSSMSLTGCGRTPPMSATSRNICWRRCITPRSRWTAITHPLSAMTCTAAEIGGESPCRKKSRRKPLRFAWRPAKLTAQLLAAGHEEGAGQTWRKA